MTRAEEINRVHRRHTGLHPLDGKEVTATSLSFVYCEQQCGVVHAGKTYNMLTKQKHILTSSSSCPVLSVTTHFITPSKEIKLPPHGPV